MSSEKLTLQSPRRPNWQLPAFVILLALIGLFLWQQLQPLADWLSYTIMGLEPDTRLGKSVNFFLYDVPKILLLLTGMIFLVTIVRSFFSPERTRAALGGRREGVGNVLAAGLGVLTPFCSCSAVPLFIGFVESGIPLGITFSFLIATRWSMKWPWPCSSVSLAGRLPDSIWRQV